VVNLKEYKTNLDEVVRDFNYDIIPERDIILFSLAKVRYEEDYLKEILPRIMNNTIENSLRKLEDGSFRESSLLGGGLIVYDKDIALGHDHRDDINFVEREEQVDIFGDKEKKTLNLNFYNVLKKILERSEGADWIIMNKYRGSGTIRGVIESYTNEFRTENKYRYNYNIDRYDELVKKIRKLRFERFRTIRDKEKKARLSYEIENLNLKKDNLLGTFKDQMDIYINDAADITIPHMKLKSAFATAMHANDNDCFVYHVSQTPKLKSYLGGIIEFGKLGVARKIRFNLDIDGQIADICKSCRKNFIYPDSNGLYAVLEEYKFGPVKQKDGSEVKKVHLDISYLVEPRLMERLSSNKVKKKEKPKRRFWSFGRR